MPHLFEPLPLRNIKLANRIAVSPMCQYSSDGGFANDWHFVHLGSRAVGGAGLVFTEAAAVLSEGRISPQDLGIWSDDHVEPLAKIVRFIHEQGGDRGRKDRVVPVPPPSEPDRRVSRIRLSSRWFYLQED
jgi:2,4-dienoyl-CoA reductase-like NADH-dependent reductase (Old Yellow Enzyme family)